MKQVSFGLLKVGWILVWGVLVACQPLSVPAPTHTTTPNLAQVGAGILTLRPTLFSTPTETATVTLTFVLTTLPTLTPTPSPTATWTPAPTLSAEQVRATMSALSETNHGCLLPCWWGITPGETDWATAKSFFSPIAIRITEIGDLSAFSGYIDILGGETASTYSYGVENGIITKIEGYVTSTALWNPVNVLAAYGPPDEVWLLGGKGAYEDGSFPFFVTFFYPRRGFLLEYVSYKAWREGDIENGIVHGCLPGEMQYLIVWSPQEENLSYFERLAKTVHYQTSQAALYAHTLEEATGLTVERWFAERKSSEKPFCLETPASMWPGY